MTLCGDVLFTYDAFGLRQLHKETPLDLGFTRGIPKPFFGIRDPPLVFVIYFFFFHYVSISKVHFRKYVDIKSESWDKSRKDKIRDLKT